MTHSEVHEVEELFQHFCHDGEISFRQVLPHSSHIQLVERHRDTESPKYDIHKIKNQKTDMKSKGGVVFLELQPDNHDCILYLRLYMCM